MNGLQRNRQKKRDAMQKRVDTARVRAEEKSNELAKITREHSELTVNYNSITSKKRILEGMENEYERLRKERKACFKGS